MLRIKRVSNVLNLQIVHKVPITFNDSSHQLNLQPGVNVLQIHAAKVQIKFQADLIIAKKTETI